MKIENTEQAYVAISNINCLSESKRRQEKLLSKWGSFKAAEQARDEAEAKALDEIEELTAYIQKCEPDEAESILAVIFRIY